MVDPSLFSPPYDIALCAALAGRDHQVTLYGRAPRPSEPDPRASCRLDEHFYRLSERLRRSPVLRRAAGPVKVLEHAFDLARLVRRLRRVEPDVVHVQWFVVPRIDAVAIRRLRRRSALVVTVHNVVPAHGSARSVQTAGWHATLLLADRIIVHTPGSRDALLAQGVESARVDVVPHGLLPSPNMESPARSTPRDDRVEFVLFGRLREYKGADVLIKALGCLSPEQRRRLRVRVVGEPLMPIPPLLELAERLGVTDDVEWDLRYVPDSEVGAIVEAADVLVFPYRDIDASGALMKALAHGKPVVATDIGWFGEQLVDGESALVVPKEDEHALAVALGRLAGDETLRSRLAAGATALASSVASWGEIADRTEEVYGRAIEASRSRVRRR